MVPLAIFRPVAGRRAFEEAVDQIADAVRVGDMRVGERLPSERELSAQMGISRPTLRVRAPPPRNEVTTAVAANSVPARDRRLSSTAA